jgi:GT2 family glycosyltransferase
MQYQKRSIDRLKVAVVLLNYRGADLTLDCLNSLDLYLRNRLVIVVDNDSRDDSCEKIFRWIERKKNNDYLLLRNNRNSGFACGNNIGIRYALQRGVDLVWLLNNDTTIDLRALDELLYSYEHHGDFALYGSVIRYHDTKEVQCIGGGELLFFRASTSFLQEHGQVDYLMGASLLVPAKVFASIGLLDERFFIYWEDVEFSFRAKSKGLKIVTADASIVYHRESSTAKQAALDPCFIQKHRFVGVTLFFTRYYPLTWVIPVMSCLVQCMSKLLLSGRIFEVAGFVRESAAAIVSVLSNRFERVDP